MRVLFLLTTGVAILAAAPAAAETLTMTGLFPAPSREAAMLRSISVERLGGRDGAATGMAIERALGRPNRSGNSYFEIVYGGRRGNGGGAEGVLSGAISSGVEDSYYKRPEKRCIQKDKDNKCLKEEEVQINCTRRVANLNADLRIVRYDGRIVYSVNRPLREEITWCQGQSPSRTAEEMINGMINQIAEGVRSDTVPVNDTYSIRILESSKGIPKEHTRFFKDTIKLTQRNPGQACQDWAKLNQLIPNNGVILFNMGLCAEWRGDLQGALQWYRIASPLLGRRNEADTGTNRVQRRMTADADAAERNRRR
ncbi:hypothetical protein P1X14_20020 [Sphingomonas sp. AOB5]|uniref:tetratricopeptide repeat protein n=1 Tax=Sphingomonas sp. AOB5 TaxID=3034017 RepID=UPI0023FA1BA3|nr:hypothetical protein [Sphingomonas sp. AOB5]MDF7777553.1 hypothetical protein [Sphingomonas sp. AOB5]